MSDHVYDAIADKFHQAAYWAEATAQAHGEPFVVYGATLAPDGSLWCALLGENIMEGVTGFGDTPAKAVADFNANWYKQQTPHAMSTIPCSQPTEEKP